MSSKTKEIHLAGVSICDGIAIGKPYFLAFQDDDIPEFSIASKEVEDEVQRYRWAVSRSERDLARIYQQLKNEGVSEGAAILEAHLQILYDPMITEIVENKIRKTKKNSEVCFHEVMKECELRFQSVDDDYFRERVQDIRDLARRIMAYLRKSVRISLMDIPKNSIVFSKDLAPSDTAEVNLSQVRAFVTEGGGETSHAAILARARGIPYVARVDFHALENYKGEWVIVDGEAGKIILHPKKSTLEKYGAQQIRHRYCYEMTATEKRRDAETVDGWHIVLSANADSLEELERIHHVRGYGVGLLRSEYLFLMRQQGFPSEEEQFTMYRKVLDKLRGLPLVLRTFDVGGDKFQELTGEQVEANPFLGCRAIRFLLKEKEIFKDQLRALLRASAFGELRILLPMISGLSELLCAKKLFMEAKEELKSKGIPFSNNVQIGCMIEVPSAAIMCDVLAKECDFLSIGTNDLVQYTLAVDRGNPDMGHLYAPAHPSVIRLIKMVVTESNRMGVPVSVCGEIAADARFIPLLLGLGVRELSMAPRYIPKVRKAVCQLSIADASRLAEEALTLSTAEEVHALLKMD